MKLSNDLVSLFVKATKDTTKTSRESTVYGTVVQYGDSKYVQIDGSDQLTPCASVADASVGERVSVLIKDHSATITGNLSSPSAKNSTVQSLDDAIAGNVAYKITANDIEAIHAMIEHLEAILIECEELSAEEITAILAQIETLKAMYIEADYITTEELKAIVAEIESLQATFANITNLSTEHLEALYAEINQLKVYSGDFTYLVAEEFKAMNAVIKNLDVENLEALYATIDFANIGEAAIENLFAKSGIIENLVVSEGHITGMLVGVTIKGDLIEGGTIVADKLVVMGEDGLYYKLNVNGETVETEQTEYNSLNGSIITAQSITATKIAVDDLVAFDATIGGFNITENSLYSGVKASADNTTRGIYLDREGQLAVGDSKNYLKYYKDTDGSYKLAISAGSIVLAASGKTVEETVQEAVEDIEGANIRVGGRNLIRQSAKLTFENYYFSGDFITSYDGSGNLTVTCGASASHDDTGNVTIRTSATITDDGNGNVTVS